jgi:RHS repeat-associated protein
LNIIYEENTAGTATHIYGPKGRLAKRTTISQESNTFYYHTDHLGSIRLVTDDDKTIVSAVTYHPFGEPCAEEGSEHYLFNGKEQDATDLYYYGARYYDPELGRFLTRDTAMGSYRYPQSLNRYSYCRNNPLAYVDPDGRMEKKFTREGSSHAGTPTEYMYFFLSFGTNKGTVDIYVLKSANLSKVMISGLISFTVQKTVGKAGTAENIVNFTVSSPSSRSPNVFTVSVEGIENANISFIIPEGVDIPVKGAGIHSDHINILWQINEAEAGDTFYVYFYFTVSASGEVQIVVVISTDAIDPRTSWEDLAETTETKKAQAIVIPASSASDSDSGSNTEIM